MKGKILIADDEIDLARATRMILQYSGYEVDETHNGKEALEKVKENGYDLIILDIMMPVMDGLETLKNIRQLNIDVPVMLLTAKSQIEDKVEGLDGGANDYLTKPFNKDELLARIRALTRYKEEKNQKYEIGNIVLDKQNMEISSQRASLHLSSKECELAEFLIKNENQKFSSSELKNRVWTGAQVEDGIVPMYVSYLQDKLSAINANIKISAEGDNYMLEKSL